MENPPLLCQALWETDVCAAKPCGGKKTQIRHTLFYHVFLDLDRSSDGGPHLLIHLGHYLMGRAIHPPTPLWPMQATCVGQVLSCMCCKACVCQYKEQLCRHSCTRKSHPRKGLFWVRGRQAGSGTEGILAGRVVEWSLDVALGCIQTLVHSPQGPNLDHVACSDLCLINSRHKSKQAYRGCWHLWGKG